MQTFPPPATEPLIRKTSLKPSRTKPWQELVTATMHPAHSKRKPKPEIHEAYDGLRSHACCISLQFPAPPVEAPFGTIVDAVLSLAEKFSDLHCEFRKVCRVLRVDLRKFCAANGELRCFLGVGG